MLRVYITTIPLQGFKDLEKNLYRSTENVKELQTRFPILQVLCNTMQEGDEAKVIAIRSVNGDTTRNFGYFKEELQALGVPETQLRSCPCRMIRTATP